MSTPVAAGTQQPDAVAESSGLKVGKEMFGVPGRLQADRELCISIGDSPPPTVLGRGHYTVYLEVSVGGDALQATPGGAPEQLVKCLQDWRMRFGGSDREESWTGARVFNLLYCNAYTLFYVWVLWYVWLRRPTVTPAVEGTQWRRTRRELMGDGCSFCVNGACLWFVGRLKDIGPAVALLFTFAIQVTLPILLFIDKGEDFNPNNCRIDEGPAQRIAKGFVATYVLCWVLWKDIRILYNLLLNALRMGGEDIIQPSPCQNEGVAVTDTASGQGSSSRIKHWFPVVLGVALSVMYAMAISIVLWVSLLLVTRSPTIRDVILNGVGALFILEIDDLFVTVQKKWYKLWTAKIQEAVSRRSPILVGWRQFVFVVSAWGLILGCVGVWTLSIVCVAY